MSEGSVLRWRLRTYKFDTVDLTFSVAGAAEAIKYLEDKCRSTASSSPVAGKEPTP